MIVSVSRRTDIPALYSDWFFNRLAEGYVLVQNPRNPNRFSKVLLNPHVIDCLIFWSKNPYPMIARLDELKEYKYYFQFTLTPYENDIEAKLPPVAKRIEIFKQLSDKIGPDKIVWRYDPIFINEKHSIEFHQEAFFQMASQLKDYTGKCIISFIDHYSHIKNIFNKFHISPMSDYEIKQIMKSLSQTVSGTNLKLETCAEDIDLSEFDILHGACIDKEMIEQIIGCPLVSKKDKNQRLMCNCIESIDIGTYDSCPHGCIYCYATTNNDKVYRNMRLHDKNSPKLLGYPHENDIITDKEMKLLRTNQKTLF